MIGIGAPGRATKFLDLTQFVSNSNSLTISSSISRSVLQQEQACDVDKSFEKTASNLAGMFGGNEDAGEALFAELVEQPLCKQLADTESLYGGSMRSSQPEELIIRADDAARLLKRELAKLGQDGAVRGPREQLAADECL